MDLFTYRKHLNTHVKKIRSFFFTQVDPDKVSIIPTTEVYHFAGSAKPWYWYNFLFFPTFQMWHEVAKRTVSAYASALFWEYIALLYGALAAALPLFAAAKKANTKQKTSTRQRLARTLFVEVLVMTVVLIIAKLMPLNMFPHTATFLMYWFAGRSPFSPFDMQNGLAFWHFGCILLSLEFRFNWMDFKLCRYLHHSLEFFLFGCL